MLDHAAALTYYALLSLFPALLLGVSILGLVGQDSLIADAAGTLRDAGAPAATVDAVVSALESTQENRATAGVAAIIGGLVALNGASGAFGAAGRALNVVFRVEEGRGFVKRKLADLGSTALVLVAGVVTLVLVFLGGGLADAVLGGIGLGDTAANVWTFARWPAALVSAMVVYALVHWLAPNVRVMSFKVITPGALIGVLVWLAASAGFFLYCANLASYGATYGAFAALVVLLVWLWITNVALLFGAEVNAVADTRRSPELPPRYDGPPLPVKEAAEA